MNEELRPEVSTLLISDIYVGDRFRKDYKDMEALQESITSKGLITPIAVKHGISDDRRFILLAGGRRLAACTALGWKYIPARTYPSNITPVMARSIELEENLQREGMTWQEEVNLKEEIHRLRTMENGEKKNSQDTGWSLRQTATLLGESPSNIQRDIKLAKAIETIPELKQCKTKSDAAKLMSVMEERMIQEELSKRAQAQIQNGTIETKTKQMIDSYIICDVVAGLKKVENGTIHFVEMDPPYAIDLQDNKKDYDNAANTRDYNEVSRDQYKQFMFSVYRELYRTMAKDSWLIHWCAWDWLGDVKQWLTEAGFTPNPIPGIWFKTTTGQTNWPEYCLGSCCEPFIYAMKGKPVIAKPGRSNAFVYKPVDPMMKVHPTERPLALIEYIIETFCQPMSIICSPFLGSGNTLLAAANMNQPIAFGYDISEQYKRAYTARVTAPKTLNKYFIPTQG